MEGDTVLCAEGGEKMFWGDTVLCVGRGERLRGGRYSIFCRESE